MASNFFDVADHQLKDLAGRLEAGDANFWSKVREEAFSGRHSALLQAIARQAEVVSSTPAAERVRERAYLSRYRSALISEHGFIEPPDFERRRRVPIDEIYVPPSILAEPDAKSGINDPIDIWEFGRQVDRSVLLGDPGGGKSTASSVLIHGFAKDPSAPIPLLVVLREYARDDPPSHSIVGYLEHRLETHYQCKAPDGLVERLLLTGKAVVFFDGLDELVDTRRRREVSKKVEHFCTQYPQTSALITSRRVGYGQARLDEKQFATYQLAEFSRDQAKEYAIRWFRQERRLGEQEPDEWASAFIGESSNISDLRSNPLMLALLCILYRGEGSLPRNRPGVYERCASLLFETWDSSRGIHQNLRARDLIEPVLRHLAHWLLSRKAAEPAVSEEELVQETTQYLKGRKFDNVDESAAAAREFIEFCRGRAWVFNEVGTTVDGEPLFTFTHRTFLEYFTAAHLASINDTPEKLARSLAPYIAREEWDVVAQLAVQIKNKNTQDGASRFFQALLGSRKYTAPGSVGNLLAFLARCLTFLDLPPKLIRDVTDRCFKHMWSDLSDFGRTAPLGWLMLSTGSRSPIACEQLCALVEEAIEEGSEQERTSTLQWISVFHLPTYIANRTGPHEGEEIRKYWQSLGDSLTEKHKDRIIAGAPKDPMLTRIAFRCDWISLDQAMDWHGAGFLFSNHRYFIGGLWHEELASDIMLSYVVRDHPRKKIAIAAMEELSKVDNNPLARPNSLQATSNEKVPFRGFTALFSMEIHGDLDLPLVGRAGFALLLTICFEAEPGMRLGSLDNIDPISSLKMYWSQRIDPTDGVDLPPLDFAPELQDLFNAWAAGQLSFWRSTEIPAARD
ncbi:NACHT domain-containing protein [Actinomadura sp. HBU206391]|uniref:NACHT domain-containing protein n=1 Tax=Actinomadura sp. HBU206391 TaxID=2731692 RepID=UPI0021CA3908|nr:NACHT domain-containing protein [Actinomadura sp. HBU206391]